MNLIKTTADKLDEHILENLKGKYIYVPTNKVRDEENKEHNIWFAGQVAGYEKTKNFYDYVNEKFLETPIISFNILLTDGMCYVLSEESVIYEITEEEFLDLVERYYQNGGVLDEETD